MHGFPFKTATITLKMELTNSLSLFLLVSVGHVNAEDLSKALTCPDVNESDHTDFLPSKTSCSEYFACNHGEPVLMHCPEGLYWDQSNDICTLPDQISPPCTGTYVNFCYKCFIWSLLGIE